MYFAWFLPGILHLKGAVYIKPICTSVTASSSPTSMALLLPNNTLYAACAQESSPPQRPKKKQKEQWHLSHGSARVGPTLEYNFHRHCRKPACLSCNKSPNSRPRDCHSKCHWFFQIRTDALLERLGRWAQGCSNPCTAISDGADLMGWRRGNGVICGDILGGVSMWEASEGCEMVGSESRGESESDAGTACTC